MGEILIDNEASIKRLAEISVGFAQAGADIVAPSDMMDGRISAIKAGLNECGLGNKVWLSLSIIHCLDMEQNYNELILQLDTIHLYQFK